MPTEYICEGHHILRHIKASLLRRDEQNNILGVLPQAFRLKEDEDYLSAWWVEYFADSQRPDEASMLAFSAVRRVKKNDRFAKGNVAMIKSTCAAFGNKIRVTREPYEGGEAHCGLRQFRDDNEEMLDALAAEAWADLLTPPAI